MNNNNRNGYVASFLAGVLSCIVVSAGFDYPVNSWFVGACIVLGIVGLIAVRKHDSDPPFRPFAWGLVLMGLGWFIFTYWDQVTSTLKEVSNVPPLPLVIAGILLLIVVVTAFFVRR